MHTENLVPRLWDEDLSGGARLNDPKAKAAERAPESRVRRMGSGSGSYANKA